MPINQPAQENDASPTDQAWKFEATALINRSEQRITALVMAIEEATDLAELKELAKEI